MAHNYEVGTRAWQPDPTEGWIASEVKEKHVDGDKVQLIFSTENGEVRYHCSHLCESSMRAAKFSLGLDKNLRNQSS